MATWVSKLNVVLMYFHHSLYSFCSQVDAFIICHSPELCVRMRETLLLRIAGYWHARITKYKITRFFTGFVLWGACSWYTHGAAEIQFVAMQSGKLRKGRKRSRHQKSLGLHFETGCRRIVWDCGCCILKNVALWLKTSKAVFWKNAVVGFHVVGGILG